MKKEAEAGAMAPQATELPKPADAGRGENQSPRRPPEGAWACRHLDLKLLASRIVREDISVVLSH